MSKLQATTRSNPRLSQTLAQAQQASEDQQQPAAEHLAARGLVKSYHKGQIEIPVLRGIDMAVNEGEFLSIVGQSGCGKSTLLHLLGTLDQPDSGEIHFDGHRIDNLPKQSRDLLRNRYIGMIFQFYHLLPEFTTLQNILTPAYISQSALGYWRNRKTYIERAEELLELVGMSHRAKHKPAELSGGEMQRTAVARALMLEPRVLLADEPTGNLDRSTGEQIMEMLRELNTQQKLTIVMVTHDNWISEQADREIRLDEGRVA